MNVREEVVEEMIEKIYIEGGMEEERYLIKS